MKTIDWVNNILEHYESEDFKDNYAFILYEDTSGNEQAIRHVLERHKNEFNTVCFFNYEGIKALSEVIAENLYLWTSSDDIKDFSNYYVGSYEIVSVSFGEQEEQITEGLDLTVISDHFSVNDGYAYYDLSGSGIYLELTQDLIDKGIEFLNK